ncbi:MAG: hypothetical protein JRE23_00110 [Deltaproteobacteria bacterium]|nr:hypothetical protein [Deltaproteobacteria bacterium]
MKYAIEQRLRMIDFLLGEYGYVNRGAIMDFFGIGPATATRDFTAYKKLQPGMVVYDGGNKAYYRTQTFQKKWV